MDFSIDVLGIWCCIRVPCHSFQSEAPGGPVFSHPFPTNDSLDVPTLADMILNVNFFARLVVRGAGPPLPPGNLYMFLFTPLNQLLVDHIPLKGAWEECSGCSPKKALSCTPSIILGLVVDAKGNYVQHLLGHLPHTISSQAVFDGSDGPFTSISCTERYGCAPPAFLSTSQWTWNGKTPCHHF